MKYFQLTFIFGLISICNLSYGQDTISGVVLKNEMNINSKLLEFSPTFYNDGIVFIVSKADDFKTTDQRIKYKTTSIFKAVRTADGSLGKPELFSKKLDTKYHDGPISLDNTGGILYFCRNNFDGKKLKFAQDGYAKMQVYQTQKTGNDWSKPNKLSFCEDQSDYDHPSLNLNGDMLYFASNRPGGQGGMDLYVTKLDNGSWSEPVNLGPSINSERDEVFPFIHADGTLFFSSNRSQNNAGGLDIYQATSTNDQYTTAPIQLGYPFNTAFDDFGFIIDLDQKNGYLSSNRPNGQGNDDIYSFTCYKSLKELLNQSPNEAAHEVLLFVSDEKSGKGIPNAKCNVLNINDLNTSSKLSIPDNKGNIINIDPNPDVPGEFVLHVKKDESKNSYKTNADGNATLLLSPGSYVFACEAANYQTKQEMVNIASGTKEHQILLSKAGDCTMSNFVFIDERYNTPAAGATVTISVDGTDEKVTLTADNQGKVSYCVPNNKKLTVTAEKGDYKVTKHITTGPGQNNSTASSTNPNANSSASYAMSQSTADYASPSSNVNSGSSVLAPGSTIKLPLIYYNFNDSRIRPDARKDLDALAFIMQKYSDLFIELRSHTDSRGTDNYNLDLSNRRAKNALEYLIKGGVNGTRMTAAGYGETSPVNKCTNGVRCSEKMHQLNRRTEFVVIAGTPTEELNKDISSISKSKGSKRSKSKSTASVSSSSVVSSGSGTFLVIAGTFKDESNATKRMMDLRNSGYTSAELIVTENMNYQAVLVGKFDNKKEAQNLSQQLNGKGFEAYIKRF